MPDTLTLDFHGMQVVKTDIPDVKVLRLTRHDDARGFFSETFSRRILEAAGIGADFVQDNHSLSRDANVLRGLHFQIGDFAQSKLLRVIRGSIFDVAVDLRRGSPTFGRHMSAIVGARDWSQIYVPVGFAHGFCTLEPDTEVLYKVSAYYAPTHERGLLWSDPALGIDWPVDRAAATVSPKDQVNPTLAELPAFFTYVPGQADGVPVD